MSDVAARRSEPMTVEAFLEFCDTLPDGERWELIDDAPMMMTGGTAAHSLIISNLLGALDPAARKRGRRAMTSFLASFRTPMRLSQISSSGAARSNATAALRPIPSLSWKPCRARRCVAIAS
jgi:hypothetical protein